MKEGIVKYSIESDAVFLLFSDITAHPYFQLGLPLDTMAWNESMGGLRQASLFYS